MNPNKLTIKSQEALQQAQQLVQEYGQQQIENVHLLLAITMVDENVLPFLFKKLNVNLDLIIQLLKSQITSLPKVEGGELQLSRETNRVLNASMTLATKMGDDYVSIEHLLISMFDGKSKTAQILKDQGISKKNLEMAIEELRNGNKVDSQSAEETYNSLNKYAKKLKSTSRSRETRSSHRS